MYYSTILMYFFNQIQRLAEHSLPFNTQLTTSTINSSVSMSSSGSIPLSKELSVDASVILHDVFTQTAHTTVTTPITSLNSLGVCLSMACFDQLTDLLQATAPFLAVNHLTKPLNTSDIFIRIFRILAV